MTLSGLTSWTKEWLGPPPSAWQERKVWAEKIHGESRSRDTAECESRVVEFESGLRYQHQIWHWVLRCLQALCGFHVISTMQFQRYSFLQAVSFAEQRAPEASLANCLSMKSGSSCALYLQQAEFTPVLSR